MIKKILSFLILFLLTGCFQQTIVMDKNSQSGEITYDIKYTDFFVNFIKYHNKTDDLIFNSSLLFNKANFEKTLSQKENLKLINYTESDVEGEKNYNIKLLFTDIESLTSLISPFFVKNSIFSENSIVYCQAKLSLDFLGDTKKIFDQYSKLDSETKSLIDVYSSLVKFKIVYITPMPIIINSTTKGIFFAEPFETFNLDIFEKELLEKSTKREDIDVFNTFYRKDRLKNIYTARQKIDDSNRKIIANIMFDVGFKNKVTYEYSLQQLLNFKKDVEISVAFRKE
ncbi:MAG: hypothetical protein A2086_13190 [Spirochaetes bacterium GWD1_27_9]|nr:MAG: hypothetical protein A2Z98_02735 [Spirochaetes bacterium GWB1_27_13]OHD23201.1 MAG: hypothetical protein A2Y34_09425 [Spirochaetes bacterium GWC1_27_15]OHD44073.1 MAG: hypothetical protein A2086_13190 [Spirochaetes bacterium GWD1_27_9]